MTATQIVDLAIIGTGSGNSIPNERFDDRSIAIFEETGKVLLHPRCVNCHPL